MKLELMCMYVHVSLVDKVVTVIACIYNLR